MSTLKKREKKKLNPIFDFFFHLSSRCCCCCCCCCCVNESSIHWEEFSPSFVSKTRDQITDSIEKEKMSLDYSSSCRSQQIDLRSSLISDRTKRKIFLALICLEIKNCTSGKKKIGSTSVVDRSRERACANREKRRNKC